MPDEKKDPNEAKKSLDQKPESSKKKESDDSDLNEEVNKSKDVLSDKLDTPGGLEIEEMAESTELQKRRDQTKKRLKALSDVDEDLDDHLALDSPFEGEGGLAAILQEANLSPRHLRFCCSGILVFIVVILMIWGATKIIKGPNEKVDKPKKDKQVEEVLEEGLTLNLDGDIDQSIYTGLLVGADEVSEGIETELGEDLGDAPLSADTFIQQMEDFSDIYNSLQVDVQQMLNQSNDRSKRLDEYLDQLEFHEFLARENISQLHDDINQLVDKVSAAEREKDAMEAEFFEDFNNLDSYGSSASLGAFINLGQEVVKLRAELQARQNLLSFYSAVSVDLELRIRDIDLNREALLKGVQVVFIRGSDLDLIIDENDI